MTKEEIIEIGDIYIDALKNGNFEKVPFAPDVVFDSAVYGKITGIEAVLNILKPISESITTIEKGHSAVEGKDLFLSFEWETSSGEKLQITDFFSLDNGKILYLKPYFFVNPMNS